MFVSLVQSTESEEGTKSSVVLQAVHLACARLPVTYLVLLSLTVVFISVLPMCAYASPFQSILG